MNLTTNVIPSNVPSARKSYTKVGFGDAIPESSGTTVSKTPPQATQTETTQTIVTPTASATQTVTPAVNDPITGAVLNKLA
jgi:hypothetical protein